MTEANEESFIYLFFWRKRRRKVFNTGKLNINRKIWTVNHVVLLILIKMNFEHLCVYFFFFRSSSLCCTGAGIGVCWYTHTTTITTKIYPHINEWSCAQCALNMFPLSQKFHLWIDKPCFVLCAFKVKVKRKYKKL